MKARSKPKTSDSANDFASIGPILTPCMPPAGIVANWSIPLTKTLPHITQSTRYATTPAMSPASHQLMVVPPRWMLAPLSGNPDLGHRPQVQDFLQLLSFEDAFLDHQLAHRDVLRHRLFRPFGRFRIPGLRRGGGDERGPP